MRPVTLIKVVSRIMRFEGCFLASALVLPLSTSVAQGTVSGRVTLMEKPGQKTTDLDAAVIWLEPVGGSTSRPRALKAEVAMRSRQFSPHVRVVTVGSAVQFPNQDPFSHNIFSSTPGSAFDLGLYGRGQTKEQVFAKPGAIPVYCNVHAKMASFVIVVPTPWYAQASADGRWSIGDVPAGTYTLHIWHERGTEQTRSITVTANGADAAEAQLDARGYVLAEHKDKWGKDYTAPGQVKY